MENFDIIYIGHDYSNISKTKYILSNNFKNELEKKLETAILKNGIVEDNSIFGNILNVFLNKSENLKVISRSSETKLYQDNNERFDGVVGVLTNTISMSAEEILGSEKTDDIDKSKIDINIKLQIHSRMDINEDVGADGMQENIEKPYFLSTLLLYGNLDNPTDEDIPNSYEDVFDFLLIFWFFQQIKDVCDKGFYRTYQRIERNDTRLKGTIDFARHIRLNLGQDNGKIAYSYREHTVDNFLNHLILSAYRCLKRKYPSLFDKLITSPQNSNVRDYISSLENMLSYTNNRDSMLLFKNAKPISHPFYTEYEALRKTCIMILQNEGISIFDDGNENSSKGILYYIPDLWEDYLEALLREKIDKGIDMESQDEIKIFDKKNTAKPDFVFYNDKEKKEPFMILDAKFRPKWEEAISGKVLYLDDYDKCIRDMNTINAHSTGVIFPVSGSEKIEQDEQNQDYSHKISEFNRYDRFYTFPIYVPRIKQNASYEKWYGEFMKSAGRDLKKIVGKINEERDRYKERKGKLKKLSENLSKEKCEEIFQMFF